MATKEEIGQLLVSATLDSQGFQNGVSNLKRDLAVTKSEFVAASASLGSFGSELDKLKLRSDSLASQMTIQQQIVETLNAAYLDAAAAKGEDAKQTEQLAIKLNNAKASLATMADQLKVTNIEIKRLEEGSVEAELEIKNFGEAVEGVKGHIENTHAAIIGMMGVMAGGLLAEWTESSEAMAVNLQKLQEETGDASPGLERLAVVASGAGVSADQLSMLVGRLDMRISTATVGTKSFADSLDKLGINAKEFAESNLDKQAQLIAEGIEKSNLPAKELSSTLKGLGVDSKELGSNAQSNLKVISNSLAETTDNGSTLARVLKQAGINMQEFVGADVETKLQMLGKYFEETKDKSQATAVVMQVFGKSGQDMLPLIQNFAELDGYAKTLKMPVMDTQEIQLAAEKTKMLQTAMQMMMDSVLVKVLPFVDNLGKAFYNLVANINHPTDAINEFVNDLGPVPAAITGVVTAFAAMKIVKSIVSATTEFKNAITATATTLRVLRVVENEETGAKSLQLAGWIKSTAAVIANTAAKVASTVATGAMTAATKAAAIAQAAFNAVMDANPIALVILAIAALAVGIYELVKHWTVVRDALSAGWNWLKNEAVSIWNGITAFFKKWGIELLAIFVPVIGLPLLIAKHWSEITEFAKKIWLPIEDFFSGIWKSVTDNATAMWGDFKSVVLGTWSDIWTGIKSFINFIIGGINDMIRALDGIQFSIPKWVPGIGGDTFSLGIPQIPMLADGGIADRPTLAMFGEAGPEAVIPLSSDRVRPFAKAIANELTGSGGSGGAGLPLIQVNINAPVYGVDDLHKAIKQGVENHVVPVLVNKGIPTARALGYST